MARKNKIPDAILAADLHIRPDKPRARTDNFQEAMWRKFEFILDLSDKYMGCPILFAGDIGNEAEWPDWLLREVIYRIQTGQPRDIFVIPGQHDLPNHNLKLWPKSALGVLEAAASIALIIKYESHSESFFIHREGSPMGFYIHGFPYGKEIEHCEDCKKKKNHRSIAMTHDLILSGKAEGWEEGKGLNGKALLKAFPEYDLILSGDNHKPFVIEYQNRLLVNPGSMMRSSADQIDHLPRVYLWYAEENKVEPVYLPIEKEVLSREHLEKKKEKDDRMEAFVLSLKNIGERKKSFEDNMKAHLRENPTTKPVEERIWTHCK